jgi:ATP-dependent DNA helicase RecG
VNAAHAVSQERLNKIDALHTQFCPEAAPESRRIPVTIDGKPNFVISIFLPYRGFLVETHKSEAFIRRGDTKHKMTPEEKDDFRSTRHERSWEQRPSGVYQYPDDFDRAIISEFCNNFREREGKDWSNEEVLIDRHLASRVQGVLTPLNCMVIFAAKDPRIHHPGCRVRVQRFEGLEEGSGSNFKPLTDLYLEGNIPAIITKANATVSSLNYNVTWLNNEGKFVTTPEYPRWAWFEAIVNALVHRSYSFSGSEITIKFFADRLEIESPGGFVPPVNATNVYHHRASRNPHLMEALRFLGFVQMTREGTRRMKESMEQYNLPAPTFSQETMHGVSVRVPPGARDPIAPGARAVAEQYRPRLCTVVAAAVRDKVRAQNYLTIKRKAALRRPARRLGLQSRIVPLAPRRWPARATPRRQKNRLHGNHVEPPRVILTGRF